MDLSFSLFLCFSLSLSLSVHLRPSSTSLSLSLSLSLSHTLTHTHTHRCNRRRHRTHTHTSELPVNASEICPLPLTHPSCPSSRAARSSGQSLWRPGILTGPKQGLFTRIKCQEL